MLGPTGPLKWFSLLTASYLLTFVPGFILVGIAVLNGDRLPALAGWLLIIGMVVSNIGALFKPIFILRNLGGVVFGIGLAWLGLAVMAG
jgi:hypothetical protein